MLFESRPFSNAILWCLWKHTMVYKCVVMYFMLNKKFLNPKSHMVVSYKKIPLILLKQDHISRGHITILKQLGWGEMSNLTDENYYCTWDLQKCPAVSLESRGIRDFQYRASRWYEVSSRLSNTATISKDGEIWPYDQPAPLPIFPRSPLPYILFVVFPRLK